MQTASAAAARWARAGLPPASIHEEANGQWRLIAQLVRGGWSWFLVAFVVYLATAVVLVLQLHLIVGDALSRVGSANYILFSRDPHLAAIGFVWGPLPSLLLLPFVPFQAVWPALVQDGFAASIVSALAMAAAVRQVHLLLVDWALRRPIRWALVALFALHPMTLQYGANGDSEALFLMLLLIVVRQLTLWFRDERLSALVFAGIAIGLAYLVRYETVAAAIAVGALVTAVTFARRAGPPKARLLAGVADAMLAVVPFALTFSLWAVASLIIMGDPFEQFTSQYGTAAQLAMGAAGNPDGPTRLAITANQLVGLQPFAIVAIALGGLAVVRRRDLRIVSVVTVFGSVLAFSVLAWLLGKTSGWLRYAIAIVPLTILLFAAWLAPAGPVAVPGSSGGAPRAARTEQLTRFARGAWGAARAVTAIAVIALAVPSTMRVMADPIAGREDHYWGFEQPRYVVARDIADYVDSLALADGAVLVDTFLGFPIVLDSSDPKQFVVTSDRDFQQFVADPSTFRVRYILVPRTGGLGGLDAIEQRWPSLYANGAGFANLDREFGTGTGFTWRLYRLTR